MFDGKSGQACAVNQQTIACNYFLPRFDQPTAELDGRQTAYATLGQEAPRPPQGRFDPGLLFLCVSKRTATRLLGINL